jgi:hypothetical protein
MSNPTLELVEQDAPRHWFQKKTGRCNALLSMEPLELVELVFLTTLYPRPPAPIDSFGIKSNLWFHWFRAGQLIVINNKNTEPAQRLAGSGTSRPRRLQAPISPIRETSAGQLFSPPSDGGRP